MNATRIEWETPRRVSVVVIDPLSLIERRRYVLDKARRVCEVTTYGLAPVGPYLDRTERESDPVLRVPAHAELVDVIRREHRRAATRARGRQAPRGLRL